MGAPRSSLLKEAAQQAALPGGHRQPTPGPRQDGRPKSSEDWVEALVQQMVGASDIQDARARAAQVLHAFEQALLEGGGGQVGASAIAIFSNLLCTWCCLWLQALRVQRALFIRKGILDG